MLKKLVSGILAGICISVGGSVFLACGEEKIWGSIFFSVALICICIMGYSLYTGKVCFIPEHHKKDDLIALGLCILGNAISTFVCGLAVGATSSDIMKYAEKLCEAKLDQSFGVTLIKAIFCGILIYLSVAIYKKQKSVVGIVFCIPTFILSGFEHSVADMFYFAAADKVEIESILFILLVIVGNAIGGMLLPILSMMGTKKQEEKTE